MFRRRKRKTDQAEQAQRQAVALQARSFFESLLGEDGVLPVERLGDVFMYVDDQPEDSRPAIWGELLVPMHLALAQGGQFLKATDSALLLRDDERPLYECPASLLKEVVQRELRGATQGISVPLGGGMRYRVGAGRGQMVTIGSHWENADEGTLTLTDKRLAYRGRRQTLEFRLDKVQTLNVYGDAITVGVTNRKTNSSFRVGTPELVAGLIQGAVSHLENIVVIDLQFSEAKSADDRSFEIRRASDTD